MFIHDATTFLISEPRFKELANTRNLNQGRLWGIDARVVRVLKYPNRIFIRIRLDFDQQENSIGDMLALVEYTQGDTPQFIPIPTINSPKTI